MTNDYVKGHEYRMRTDRDYRRRHTGRRPLKAPPKTKPHKCQCGARASEYHHTRTGGRWICKTCHKRIHGDYPRGRTPHRGR